MTGSSKQSRHKGDNSFHKHWRFHSGTGRGGLRGRRGAGGRRTLHLLPRPAPDSRQGRWPKTAAEARVLTLLLLCLPMPLAPVPYGSKSDNMTHDYQGGKEAARRLHGCHTEWAEPSSPGTSCCEVRQYLPAWRVSEGAPQEPAPTLSAAANLPSETTLLTVLSALSRGTMYSPLSTNCALTQPPPSLLPASSLLWLLAAPHPHSPQGPAQLSLRRATKLKVNWNLNPCVPTATPARRRGL